MSIFPEQSASTSAVSPSHGSRTDLPPSGASESRPLPAIRGDASLSPSTEVPRKKRKGAYKQPKDSKVYKVAIAYVAMKAQGMKLADISEHLGIPKDTISTYVKRAHARGWLNRTSFEDHEDQIDVVLKSATIRNVEAFLNGGDKDVTIEAAKGLGIFKNHQAVKVEGGVGLGFALKVQVEMPALAAAQSPVQIQPGSVGGVPAIDAEIINGGDQ